MSWIAETLPISKSEKNILETLARKGESTYYELWKKQKVAASNKTVLIALKRLQDNNFIQPKTKTEGTEKKPYVITKKGLMVILTYRDVWKHIDQIAETQKDKSPLIFGKWKLLKELGITKKLYAVTTNDPSGFGFTEEDKKQFFNVEQEQYLFKKMLENADQPSVPLMGVSPEFLYLAEFFPSNMTEERKARVRRLREDKEISQFVELVLQTRLKLAETFVELHRQRLAEWKLLEDQVSA